MQMHPLNIRDQIDIIIVNFKNLFCIVTCMEKFRCSCLEKKGSSGIYFLVDINSFQSYTVFIVCIDYSNNKIIGGRSNIVFTLYYNPTLQIFIYKLSIYFTCPFIHGCCKKFLYCNSVFTFLSVRS